MRKGEYRRQIDPLFGQVVRSPWVDLRKDLVLGGESLLNKVRELVAKAQRDEEIRRRRRADAEEAARGIELLIEQEGHRRVAIWLRVRLRTHPVTTVAAEYAYRDRSGADRVIKRLEETANTDRALSRRLKALAKEVSSVKS